MRKPVHSSRMVSWEEGLRRPGRTVPRAEAELRPFLGRLAVLPHSREQGAPYLYRCFLKNSR